MTVDVHGFQDIFTGHQGKNKSDVQFIHLRRQTGLNDYR
jgi:hypothetical protein